MRQRCTGPLLFKFSIGIYLSIYTIKSGVLFCFVCLFVCDARHAFRVRKSERGVGVSTESPRQEGVRNASFVAFRAPGTETQNFKVFMGQKMVKILKI